MTRKELKQNVLTSSSLIQLLEEQPDTADIFENYLNGKFQRFQAQLTSIEKKLQYDQFFGVHIKTDVFLAIRTKTLQQYVKPYKVIDMREIAQAFGLPLDEIESNLSELITSGQIKAKIDSHKKLLISRKENV